MPQRLSRSTDAILALIAGFDFFISYGHAGGSAYAEALFTALTNRGLRCFIDRDEMPPGQDLSTATRRGLAQSRVLLLVGTARVLESDAVYEELAGFRALGRPIIPIDIAQCLANAPPSHRVRQLLGDIIRLPEAPGAVTAPSTDVVDKIVRSFTFTKQSTRRQRVLLATVIVLGFLAVAASIAAYQATRARRESDRQRQLTLAQALAATAFQQQELTRTDDVPALMVRQAFMFHERNGGLMLDQMDAALRRILDTRYFSSRLPADHGYATAVTYRSDGGVLAAGYDDGTILLWNDRRPDVEPQALLGHAAEHARAEVTGLAYCPTTTLLASSATDGSVKLWATAHPAWRGKTLFRSEIPVRTVEFADDCETLYAGLDDDTLVRLSRRLSSPPRAFRVDVTGEHDHGIWSIALHRDGHRLATAHQDGRVRLWDRARLEDAPRVLDGVAILPADALQPGGHVAMRAVDFSPTDDVLAAGGEDRAVWLWDTAEPNPRPRRLFETSDADTIFGSAFFSIAFSPDGSKLATGSDGATVAIWDMARLDTLPTVLRGHETQVLSVSFRPDGLELATASRDRSVRLWNLGPGFAAPKTGGNFGSIRGLAFVRGRERFVVGDTTGRLALWDAERDTILRTLAAPTGAPYGSPVTLSVDPARERVAMWRDDDPLRILSLVDESGPPITLPLSSRSAPSITWSNQGRQLAAAGSDGNIAVWNMDMPQHEPIRIPGHGYRSPGLAFRADDRELLVAGDDDDLRICTLATGRCRPHPVTVLGLYEAFAHAPTSQLLAFSGSEGISVGPLIGRRAWTRLRGIDAGRDELRMSPDERWLAGTGSNESVVRLWDLAQPEATPRTLRTGPRDVDMVVAFSEDSTVVAAGSWNGTITRWPLSTAVLADRVCQHVWRNLSEDEWLQFVGSDIPYERTCPDLP